MKVSKRTIFAATVLIAVAGAAGLAWNCYTDPHETSDHLVLFDKVDVRLVYLAFKLPGRVLAVDVE